MAVQSQEKIAYISMEVNSKQEEMKKQLKNFNQETGNLIGLTPHEYEEVNNIMLLTPACSS